MDESVIIALQHKYCNDADIEAVRGWQHPESRIRGPHGAEGGPFLLAGLPCNWGRAQRREQRRHHAWLACNMGDFGPRCCLDGKDTRLLACH